MFSSVMSVCVIRRHFVPMKKCDIHFYYYYENSYEGTLLKNNLKRLFYQIENIYTRRKKKKIASLSRNILGQFKITHLALDSRASR